MVSHIASGRHLYSECSIYYHLQIPFYLLSRILYGHKHWIALFGNFFLIRRITTRQSLPCARFSQKPLQNLVIQWKIFWITHIIRYLLVVSFWFDVDVDDTYLLQLFETEINRKVKREPALAVESRTKMFPDPKEFEIGSTDIVGDFWTFGQCQTEGSLLIRIFPYRCVCVPYFKTSRFSTVYSASVFSPDGKTFYLPLSTQIGHKNLQHKHQQVSDPSNDPSLEESFPCEGLPSCVSYRQNLKERYMGQLFLI